MSVEELQTLFYNHHNFNIKILYLESLNRAYSKMATTAACLSQEDQGKLKPFCLYSSPSYLSKYNFILNESRKANLNPNKKYKDILA